MIGKCAPDANLSIRQLDRLDQPGAIDDHTNHELRLCRKGDHHEAGNDGRRESRGASHRSPPIFRGSYTAGLSEVPYSLRFASIAALSAAWLRSMSGSSCPPVISSTAQDVRSRIEMMPASSPFSTTGRWRIRRSAMSLAASAISV